MADRNEVPVEQWLEVWERLRKAGEAKRDSLSVIHLETAIRGLYLLLEPPSVREARLKGDAVSAMVEEDE